MAEQTAETEQEPATRDTWIQWDLPEGELERILHHASDLEQTRVSYLWPFVLGMLAGTAVPLGLLLASL